MTLKAFASIASLVVVLLPARMSFAEPPVGDWEIISNGFSGTLMGVAVDADGNVSGTYVEGARMDALSGWWTEFAQTIVFLRGSSNQVFTGYVFANPPGATFCGPGFSATKQMAGSIQLNDFPSVQGWTARQCTP